MSLYKRQRLIIWGCILGDGYLQKVGRRSARLRLEHSVKQREYIYWKYRELKNMFSDEPQLIIRYDHKWKRTYQYYKLQSHSSPLLGKWRKWFYTDDGRKKIPENISTIIKHPLVLSVWYMDDGYYYPRDNIIYLFLPDYEDEDLKRLLLAFEEIWNLSWEVKRRPNSKGVELILPREQLYRFVEIVEPHIIPEMRYKLPL